MARLAFPMIPVSRLLKSCAIPPARRPILSSFCASRIATSLVLRSVISRIILANPRRLPSACQSGVITPLAKNRVPFLRRCQRSSSARPSRTAVSSSCAGSPCSRSSGVKQNSGIAAHDLGIVVAQNFFPRRYSSSRSYLPCPS